MPAGAERATLHAAATLGEPAPLDQDGGLTLPAIGNPAIQSGAAIGPDTALDTMTKIVHATICGLLLIRASRND
jgi:hypothetical protein